MEITYSAFIEECRKKIIPVGIYTEKHHIIPRCLGGTNDKNNLIILTAQDHYNAYKILAKENPENKKLNYAWWNMSCRHNTGQKRYSNFG